MDGGTFGAWDGLVENIPLRLALSYSQQKGRLEKDPTPHGTLSLLEFCPGGTNEFPWAQLRIQNTHKCWI